MDCLHESIEECFQNKNCDIYKDFVSKPYKSKTGRKKWAFEIKPGCEVKASGILFYTEAGEILLVKYHTSRKKRFYWEDFGGSVDKNDKSFLETAIREATEETNAQLASHKPINSYKMYMEYRNLSKNILRDLMNEQKSIPFYNPESKYVVYLVKVSDKDAQLLSQIDKFEFAEKLHRTFKWITIQEFLTGKDISPRLDFPKLMNFLKKKLKN